MMENMKINQLPSKTWNWLKMNETAISGITVSGAHEIKAEIPAGISKTNCPAGLPDQFREIAGGMGPDMDVLVSAVLLSTDGDLAETPVRIGFTYGSSEHSLNTFGIFAKEGSKMTVIMDMAAEADGTSGADHTALSGVQTKLILEKDAEVTLVQIIRNGKNRLKRHRCEGC